MFSRRGDEYEGVTAVALFQFPIAVLRSVGSLLSNTFSSDRRASATTTTATPFDF